MKASVQLSSILNLCIQIDQAAADIYASLSASAGSDALKGFWDKMAVEEQSHLEYWEQLQKYAEYEDIPTVFDDPDSVYKDLEERSQQIQELREQWENDKTINSAFVIAYRLESYKLHPAFRTLFQYYRPVANGRAPEENGLDETHITEIVETLKVHAKVTPELELVGETLQNLWNQNKSLSEQIMIDPLSNLLNRRGFFVVAHQLAYLSKRNRIPIAILLVEIDGFKSINELHGPQKADAVIKGIANELNSSLRHSDLVARYSGDQFIILLPDTAKKGSVSVTEKLREGVSMARPLGINVTVSIGMAEDVMKDDIKQSLSMLIHRAREKLP